jgi:prepilin-type N-terminal cleavage/methylation domain-containing protein
MARGARGATLIEVLVALSLLAIVAAGIFGFYATGMFARQNAANLAIATGLAQAHMEQLVAHPDQTSAAGDDPGVDPAGVPGYRWTAEITRTAPGLSQGTVTVTWIQAGRQHWVTLTTLLRSPDRL